MKERTLKKKSFFDLKTILVIVISIVIIGIQILVLNSIKNVNVNKTNSSFEYLLSTASELEEKGMYLGAAETYIKYLKYTVWLDNSEKSGIYYKIAKLYSNKIGDYKNAVKYAVLVKNIVNPESSIFKENQKLLVKCLERSGNSVDAINELKNTEVDRKIKKGGTVVATVNGNPIYLVQLEKEYNKVPEQMRKNISKRDFLDQLVFKSLAISAARRAKIDLEPQVKEKLKNVEDDYIFNEYLKRETSHLKNISEDDVRNYYKANLNKFKERAYRQVNVVKLKDKNEKPDWKSGKKSKVYPDSTYIPGIGKCSKLLSEIANTKVGEIAGVTVESNGDVYNAKVESDFPERTKTFEEVKNFAYQMYYKEKMDKEIKNLYSKLSKTGDIKLYEDRIEK